jgi:hypothetical protein
MEEVTVLPKELVATPIKGGVSIINENPIGVLEKLGKYEFIYDFNAVPFPVMNLVHHNSSNGFFNFDGDGTGGLPIKWSGQYFPQPVRVNTEAQVGFFSKGNIVNVIRFDGNNAIIENVNYKEPDPSIKKTWFGELLGGVINKKELSIPKDYLRKVDDTLEPTLLIGINYGANMKPQPIYNMPPVKPITNTVLEENATYYLTKDFKYFKNTYCPPNAQCMPPPATTIMSGSKVTGTLVRRVLDVKLNAYNLLNGISDDSNFVTLLVVATPDGNQNIPLEYLTKELPTNSGVVVPVENNNKNLLMIVGAFLVGYVVFSKGKSE